MAELRVWASGGSDAPGTFDPGGAAPGGLTPPARQGSLVRRLQDAFEVGGGGGARVDAQQPRDAGGLLGEAAQLFLLDAEVAQPQWDADVGPQPLDRLDGLLGGVVLAEAVDVLAEQAGDGGEGRL